MRKTGKKPEDQHVKTRVFNTDDSAGRLRHAGEVRDGFPAWGGGKTRVARRARVARLLWSAKGERRVPSERTFDAAVHDLAPGELERICEFNLLGPIYSLPTKRWLEALAEQLRSLGVRRVLEVGAGDGFLSRSLRSVAPDLEIIASDSAAWSRPQARMSADERRALEGTEVAGITLGDDVLKLNARAAIARVKPDLVLASWLPPGPMLDTIIRSKVRYVLDIGAAGGVTASQWSWRFAHDFCEGPLESLARCRLDERPRKALHARVTLYFGAAHPDHFEERVREGDWLWQFKPSRR